MNPAALPPVEQHIWTSTFSATYSSLTFEGGHPNDEWAARVAFTNADRAVEAFRVLYSQAHGLEERHVVQTTHDPNAPSAHVAPTRRSSKP